MTRFRDSRIDDGRTPNALWRRRSCTPWPGLVQVAILVLSALVAAGCGGGSPAATAADSDAGPPQHGGQAVMGMDQEPPCVNVALVCGSMLAALMMNYPMFDPLFIVTPDGRRAPKLATEVPTPENGRVEIDGGKMRVTVDIRKKAAWSDGTAITCKDVVFTWKTMMDDRWMIGSRLGWEVIESVECPSDKTFVITFSEPYAPFMNVLSSSPLPAHELEGKDFNEYWNDRITVSSGPFVFGYWKRNVEYVLERNPNYWNAGKEDLPYLDSLKFRFLKDTNTLKIQLRTGEVDWITPPPDTSLLDELKTFPRSRFQVVPGGFWDHLNFQNQNPPMDDVNVRKAIAYAVDRQQLTEVVLKGQTEPLHSTLLPQVKDYYVPAWEQYSYDEAKIAEHLEKAGYSRSGQYWEKDGKPLTVVIKSTAGNALRIKVVQLLQQTFKTNGIKLDITMEDAGVLFGQSVKQGSYHIGLWAFGSTVDPQQTVLLSCDQIPTKANNFAGHNSYRYCNEEVTKLFKQADATPEVKERAKITHRIQRLIAEDVPLLPLFQRPETVAYSNRLHGVENNPLGSHFWNVGEWWVDQ